MKLFELTEKVNETLLFHAANPLKALHNFQKDLLVNDWGDRALGSKLVSGISTSRNYRLAISKQGYGPWVFVLDKTKLQYKYKIIPIDANTTIVEPGQQQSIPDRQYRLPGMEHSEELIVTNTLPNLHQYLQEILFVRGSDYEQDEIDYPDPNSDFKKAQKAAVLYSQKFSIPLKQV